MSALNTLVVVSSHDLEAGTSVLVLDVTAHHLKKGARLLHPPPPPN